jgi:hypothetical protein
MKVFALILLATALCAGQRFPGFQGIQPDPETGRPVLVATSCAIATSESGDPSWAVPITVYDDSGISMYIDQDCLNMAGDVFSGGVYFVDVYSYYKDSDWPCVRFLPPNPTPEQAVKGKEWQTVCKEIVYKAQWLEVDTRAKKYKVTKVNVFDSHGFHLAILGSMKDWRSLEDLGKDPNGHSMLLAIDHTTKLVEKESAYWTARRKELQR